eukprot:646523-Amorphochlora_amoeboformis.AAC.1
MISFVVTQPNSEPDTLIPFSLSQAGRRRGRGAREETHTGQELEILTLSLTLTLNSRSCPFPVRQQ